MGRPSPAGAGRSLPHVRGRSNRRLAVPVLVICLPSMVFFFQAEDGIRDHCVTGVQTCALPISRGSDLRERIREGRFLEDLYYRLNDITVRVPALRERREDIPVLAQHFLAMYSKQMDKAVKGFAPEVMRLFLDSEWRGNVRELEKAVKRMGGLADDGEVLGLELLPTEMRESRPLTPVTNGSAHGNGHAPASAPANAPGHTLRRSISELEKKLIADALERNHGNKARVARELGLSYPTLLSRIRAYALQAR